MRWEPGFAGSEPGTRWEGGRRFLVTARMTRSDVGFDQPVDTDHQTKLMDHQKHGIAHGENTFAN